MNSTASNAIEPRPEGVLLVENDDQDASLIESALQDSSVEQIWRMKGAREAMSHLHGENRRRWVLPRVILLDLKLDRPSGLQFLEWTKNHPTFRRIPIVGFCTPYSQAVINLAYDLRVNSAIDKPVTSDGFTPIVRNLVDFWLFANTPPTFDEEPSGRSIVDETPDVELPQP